MKSEARLQATVIKYLRENDRFVIKTQGGTPGTPTGTPDVVTINRQGKLLGLEFKRPDGKGIVSPEQKSLGKKIIHNGGLWFVIDSFERFMEVWESDTAIQTI